MYSRIFKRVTGLPKKNLNASSTKLTSMRSTPSPSRSAVLPLLMLLVTAVLVPVAMAVTISQQTVQSRSGSEALGVRTDIVAITTTFSNPVVWQPYGICRNFSRCDTISLVTCCVDCQGSIPVSGSSANPAGCFCATDGYTCLDSSPRYGVISSEPGAEALYEMAILDPLCNGLVVLLESLSGNADLVVAVASTVTEYRSTGWTSDTFFFCPQLTGFFVSNRVQGSAATITRLPGEPFGRVSLRVSAAVSSNYRLSVTEATPSDPAFLQAGLPVSKYFSMIDSVLTCPWAEGVTLATNFTCTPQRITGSANQIVPWTNYDKLCFGYFAIPSAAQQAEPVPFFHQIMGNITNTLQHDLLENTVTQLFYYSVQDFRNPDGTVLQAGELDVSLCRVTFSVSPKSGQLASATDSLAVYIPSSLDALPTWLEASTMCDLQELQSKYEQHTSFLENSLTPAYVASLGSSLESLFYFYGSLISTNVWNGCLSLRDSLVLATTTTETTTTSRCTFARDTAEYAADPCCNVLLTYSQCCAPTTKQTPVSLFAPNFAAIREKCQLPQCVETIAVQSAVASQDRSLSPFDCTAESTRLLNNPAVSADVLSMCQNTFADYRLQKIACDSDADCFTSCSSVGYCSPQSGPDTITELISCLRFYMDPAVELLFANGRTTDQIVSDYSSTGCGVPGQGATVLSHFSSESECLAALGCNFNPDLDFDDCSAIITAYPEFCTVCTEFGCTDETQLAGCALYPEVSQRDCETVVARAQTGSIPVWRDGRCYDLSKTEASCLYFLPRAGDNICDGNFPGGDTCFSVCAGAVSVPEICVAGDQCLQIGDDIDQLACRQEYLWNNRSKSCFVKYGIDASGNSPIVTCQSPYYGRRWVSERFATQATCEWSDAGCSILCNDCTQAECTQQGSCSDPNKNGACKFPYQLRLTAQGVLPLCEFPLLPQADSCVDWTATEDDCRQRSGIWAPPSTTAEQCQAIQGCREIGKFYTPSTTYFEYSGLTPKSSIQCTACTAALEPFYEWTPATWFTPNSTRTWRPRAWESNVFVWRSLFQQADFVRDYRVAIATAQAFAVRSNFYCLTGQVYQDLSLLACSCGSNTSRTCLLSAALPFVSSIRVCSDLQRSTTVPETFSLDFSSSVVFSPACDSLDIRAVAAVLVRRPGGSDVSSAFVSSLKPGRYAVVENSKKVIIGEVRGDGVQLALTQGQIISGSFTLCITVKIGSSSGRFVVPDLALYNTEELSPRLPLDRSRLRPAGANSTYDPDRRSICATVSATGIYYPIFRATAWQDKSYFDTLAASQQVSLIIAVILWSLIFLLSIFCAMNYCVWILMNFLTRISDSWSGFVYVLLINLILSMRLIYFSLVLAGQAANNESIGYIVLVELPTFFFFTIFCGVLLKWLLVAQGRAGGAKRNGGAFWKSPLKIALILINVLIYLIFIIYIIVYSTLDKTITTSGGCSAGSKFSDAVEGIKITYHVLIAIVAILLAVFLIAYGIRLAIQLISLGALSGPHRIRFIQFSVVLLSVALAMILQSIILIIISSDVGINSAGSLVILIFIELIPIVALLWTWNKPLTVVSVASRLSGRFTTTGSTQASSASASGGPDNSSNGASSTTSAVSRLWSLGVDDTLSESGVGSTVDDM